MIIKANDLNRQYELYKDEYEKAALRTLRSGWFILGNELMAFEEEFADYTGSSNCIGVASGLDALVLGFRLLGVGSGDEVIVASNAYIACVMGITLNGGKPVFVEPDESFNIDPDIIESAITKKTKAILAVHLYGAPCNMQRITCIAEKYDLFVIEDCAQAHGTESDGNRVGSFGSIGCFSFYPTKTLGSFGDGGAIITNNEEIANNARILRNYGSDKKYYFSEIGMNSRLDEIQAALLRVKLSHVDVLICDHRRIAADYLSKINNQLITLPKNVSGHTWHQFVVRTDRRNELKEYLELNGIGSDIHYPIPPHLSKAYRFLGFAEGDFPLAEKYSREVLSLPIFVGMTAEEQDYIVDVLNKWR